jgi:hypothetical protein
MSASDPQPCYEEASAAGRAWATRELEQADGNLDTVAEIESSLSEATAAYVAMKTGHLPSLFFDPQRHKQERELREGFCNAACDAIAEYRRSRAA